jgi:hypothetical protein
MELTGRASTNLNIVGWPMVHDTRINRVSNKYASAKQTENCLNHFNRLTHPLKLYGRQRLIVGLCFRPASSGRNNGFAAPCEPAPSLRKRPLGICPAARRAQNSSEIKKIAAQPRCCPDYPGLVVGWSPKIGSGTRNTRPVADRAQLYQRTRHIQTA